MEMKKNRSSKTSRGQYELYLNELESNKAFRENKFDGTDPDIIKRSWSDLVTRLNASGGPIRDVAGWKRIMSDWKSQTRGKARKNRNLFLETGNVGDPPKPLTDLEERLLDLTGRVVVDGMEGIPEYGIAQQLPINKENVAQSTNTEAGPSTTIQNVPDTPVKRKRKSLTACLQDIITTKPG